MAGEKGRLIVVDRERPGAEQVAEAVAILRAGGLVAFPTETVYGLGADATNPAAVARIFAAKGRPSANPLIVHVSGRAMASEYVGEWTERAERLADVYWPGPLTLVLPKSSKVPEQVTGGGDTVAVRAPSSAIAIALINELGRPVAAPSANSSSRLSPTTAAHVVADLGERVDLILDGGQCAFGIESTVVDITGSDVRILRPGPITARQIQNSLCGTLTSTVDPGGELPGVARSPGQSPVHYAPRTRVSLLDKDQLSQHVSKLPHDAGVLILGPVGWDASLQFRVARQLCEPRAAEQELYATLHAWDTLGLSGIYVVLPPDIDDWRAVRDRVTRAAAGGADR